MTVQLVIKKGPNKLDLMLALFDSDARGPRFISFEIEGEWSHWYHGKDTPGLPVEHHPPTEAERNFLKERPWLIFYPLEIGAVVNGVERVPGGDEEWTVIGKVHGRITGVQNEKTDIPFQARFSTKNRRGTIEFPST